jgi:hypothetical protein
MDKDFVHVKNEHLYVIAMKDTFAQQVCHAIIGNNKKKFV